MFKTGNSITDSLLVITTFLPLIPVLLIFFRKPYLQEPFNFIALICLLYFLREFPGTPGSLTNSAHPAIDKIISLLLFGLFLLSFRTNLSGRVRYALNISGTALLSMVITWWSIKGWEVNMPIADTVLNGFLILVIGLSLPTVIKTGQLAVFRSPLFWMETGTAFYLLLAILSDWLAAYCRPGIYSLDPEQEGFLALAGIARYILYIIGVAAWVPENRVLE